MPRYQSARTIPACKTDVEIPGQYISNLRTYQAFHKATHAKSVVKMTLAHMYKAQLNNVSITLNKQ